VFDGKRFLGTIEKILQLRENSLDKLVYCCYLIIHDADLSEIKGKSLMSYLVWRSGGV
jgi:hypothetical protein